MCEPGADSRAECPRRPVLQVRPQVSECRGFTTVMLSVLGRPLLPTMTQPPVAASLCLRATGCACCRIFAALPCHFSRCGRARASPSARRLALCRCRAACPESATAVLPPASLASAELASPLLFEASASEGLASIHFISVSQTCGSSSRPRCVAKKPRRSIAGRPSATALASELTSCLRAEVPACACNLRCADCAVPCLA